MRSYKNSADLILHPVRFRILLAVGHREVKAEQIAALLPDVSRATVYRHVAELITGGLLVVVQEVRVRGTVERTLKRAEPNYQLKDSENRTSTPDRIEAQLHAFLEAIARQSSTYFRSQGPTMDDDDFSFWGEIIYLSPDEFAQLNKVAQQQVSFQQNNEASAERRPYLSAFLLIPSEATQ